MKSRREWETSPGGHSSKTCDIFDIEYQLHKSLLMLQSFHRLMEYDLRTAIVKAGSVIRLGAIAKLPAVKVG